MTIDQFNSMSFSVGCQVVYMGKKYAVLSIDFEEALFGISDTDDNDELSWKRCENCEFIPA